MRSTYLFVEESALQRDNDAHVIFRDVLRGQMRRLIRRFIALR